MSDQSLRRTYRGNGIGRVRVRITGRFYSDVPWAEVAFETHTDCYRARRYRDGSEAYFHNGTTITTRERMPRASGTWQLWEDFDSADFARFHADRTGPTRR